MNQRNWYTDYQSAHRRLIQRLLIENERNLKDLENLNKNLDQKPQTSNHFRKREAQNLKHSHIHLEKRKRDKGIEFVPLAFFPISV